MRVTGVEVSGFARFEQQFLPIKPGVQLLVGKNNAGKSALLRALKFQTDPGWQSYLQTDTRGSLKVWYTPADTDDIKTRQHRDGRHMVIPGEEVEVEIHLPRVGDPTFVCAKLITSTESLPLLTRHQNDFLEHWYGGGNQGSNRIIGGMSDKLLHIPDDLKEAVWIKPNRAVGHAIPASANRDVPTDGRTLATFLQTLRGDRDDLYELIEEKFCSCFPEFKKVNVKFESGPQQISQNVLVTLTEVSGRRIELENCGAGVEQALVMLACVFGTSESRLFLIDEPHNFLHPSLERILIDLFSGSKHSFLLATHSAQMINRVAAEQIILIAKPGIPKSSWSQSSEVCRRELLSELGYRNSDLLFHDALIFVEGPSDVPVLVKLFEKAGCASRESIDVGYVELSGTGDFRRFEDIQKLVIVQEKLLRSFSKTDLPHVYLFDGDKNTYKEKLANTRPGGVSIRPIFLDVYEIENYLLDAAAIECSINAELELIGLPRKATQESIQNRLSTLLDPGSMGQAELARFYPQGWKEKQSRAAVKGSEVLGELYSMFLLNYDKRFGGAELASRVVLTAEAKAEIKALFESFCF